MAQIMQSDSFRITHGLPSDSTLSDSDTSAHCTAVGGHKMCDLPQILPIPPIAPITLHKTRHHQATWGLLPSCWSFPMGSELDCWPIAFDWFGSNPPFDERFTCRMHSLPVTMTSRDYSRTQVIDREMTRLLAPLLVTVTSMRRRSRQNGSWIGEMDWIARLLSVNLCKSHACIMCWNIIMFALWCILFNLTFILIFFNKWKL